MLNNLHLLTAPQTINVIICLQFFITDSGTEYLYIVRSLRCGITVKRNQGLLCAYIVRSVADLYGRPSSSFPLSVLFS